MKYGKIFSNETEDVITFGNDDFELKFSKHSGALTAIYWQGVLISDNKFMDELSMDISGRMQSSIKLNDKNDRYPSMICVDSIKIEDAAKYLGHVLKRPMDGIELSIDVECQNFVIRKIYHISTGSLLTRKVEITYNGEEETSIQYLYLSTLGIPFKTTGLSMVETPIYSFPNSLNCEDKADNDCDFKYGPCMSGNDSILLHNKENNFTMTVWSGNIREQLNEIMFSNHHDCCFVIQKFHINAFVKKGDCICTADSRLLISNKKWEDSIVDLRYWREANGQRCKATNIELLKKTVMLEVEIGKVDFSDDVQHGDYKDVEMLINDLPNIKEMGFNTICIMPAFPFPGYTIYDLQQPEIQHNTQGRLKELVEKAHKLDVKIVLDTLLHGCVDKEIAKWNVERFSIRERFFKSWLTKGYDISPIRENHPDWFLYEDSGEMFKKYTWMFDIANQEFQDYVCQALKIYVEEYDVDGFRFDAPHWASAPNRRKDLDHLPSKSLTYGIWELFYKARQIIDPIKKDIIWLNECDGIMWRDVTDIAYAYSSYFKWDDMFRDNIKGYKMQQFYDIRKKSMPDNSLYINFSDNHDTWFMDEKGLYSYDKYNIAYSKIMLAMSLFAEGAFMSYAGFEKCYEDFFKRLLYIRNSYDIFGSGTCNYDKAICENENVFCIYWEYNNQIFIICSNISNEKFNSRINIQNLNTCDFENLLDRKKAENINDISFDPYEIKIMMKSNLEFTPQPQQITSKSEHNT